MIKKYFLLLSLFFCASFGYAQMSDDQIVDYIKTQNSAGMSQTQIAKNLLMKGVSQSQLERIKSQYEKDGSSNNNSTDQNGLSDRLRKYNGQETPSEPDSLKPARIIFGHDIFRSENLSFQPNMNIATPTTYTLGPGDEVILDIYGVSQGTNTMKVSPDGSIVIPNEQPVNVAGLTVTQAQAKIRRAIGGHYQGSTIRLTVGQTRTILVNVMGEVNTPGTYSLSAFSTVFNALYLAGGITDIGTLRNIKVSRNGRVITSVDVYDFIINGRLTGNVMLRDNDVIMVGPYENLVQVEGKVKRPMFYEMKKNESLKSLLSFAGGFTGDAYKEKVRVERKSSEGLTVHNVDDWDFTSFITQDEDVVFVSPIIDRYKNTVTVTGAVFRPGSYKIDDKVNTVKTIIDQAGGLLEQAVTSRAVLIRMKKDRTHATETVNLADIMSGAVPDVALQNEDELVIASYSTLADARKLSISGEVLNPGQFDYSENTSIGDLITMAGGLRETATLDKVEVSRRITSSADNADGNQMAKVYTFDLNDELQITDGTDFKLQPYDNVTIHRNPNYKIQKSVYVGGEVLYAGFYTLSSKDERLSEIIKRAGGLTTKAYVNGAKMIRKYTEDEMRERLQLVEVAQNAKDSLEAMKAVRKTSYSVGIDLAKAIDLKNKNNTQYDIILEAGDSIYIPQMSNVVKISGEVLSPNTVTYIQGKSASYYINQAGGVTDTGKKGKSYILYANGQVSSVSKGEIEPGCEIIVPSKVDKKTDVTKVSMWSTLASTVATVGAVVATIVK